MLFAKPFQDLTPRTQQRFVTNGTIDAAGFRLRAADLLENGFNNIGHYLYGNEMFSIADSISDEMIDFLIHRDFPGPALYPQYKEFPGGFPATSNPLTQKRRFFTLVDGDIAGVSGEIFTNEIDFGQRTRRRDYGLVGEAIMRGEVEQRGDDLINPGRFAINYVVDENDRPNLTTSGHLVGRTFSDNDGQNGAGIRNFGYYVEFYTNEVIQGPVQGPLLNRGAQSAEMRHVMSTFYGRDANLTLKNIKAAITGDGNPERPISQEAQIASKPLTQGVPIKFGDTTVTCGTAFTSFHLKRDLIEPAHYVFFPSGFANTNFIGNGTAQKIPRIVTGPQSVAAGTIHTDIILFLQAGVLQPIRD
jgi:hypothetical protein